MRTFSGNASFDEFGLHVTATTAAFLVPMTVINLASLVMLFVAWFSENNTREVDFMDHEGLYMQMQKLRNANTTG